MKDNIEVIPFHIKKGYARLRFREIMFEKYTTNFYFENGKVSKKQQFPTCSPY